MGAIPTLLFSLVAVLLITAAAAIVVTDRRRQSHRLRLVRAERDRAHITAATAIHTLRLAAIELRTPATALLGHID